MATYYSDRFSGTDPDTGLEDDTILDRQKRSDAGIGHGRLRYKRAQVTVDLETDDGVRMMQFKSGDRLVALYLTCTASGAAGTIAIGLEKTGRDHDGVCIDFNIIANNVAITSAINRTDKFGINSTIATTDRGRTLWEVADKSASWTFTEDPMEDWDLGIHAAAGTTNETTVILEAYYTAGG
mgnify:CR=1 FL=1